MNPEEELQGEWHKDVPISLPLSDIFFFTQTLGREAENLELKTLGSFHGCRERNLKAHGHYEA